MKMFFLKYLERRSYEYIIWKLVKIRVEEGIKTSDGSTIKRFLHPTLTATTTLDSQPDHQFPFIRFIDYNHLLLFQNPMINTKIPSAEFIINIHFNA